MRDLLVAQIADQVVGVELFERIARAVAPRHRAGRRWRRQIELLEIRLDLGDTAALVLDLGDRRAHPRDAQPESTRELERAGVRAVHAEQLLQVRLRAIRIGRRDELGELEALFFGLLLAALRDQDV